MTLNDLKLDFLQTSLGVSGDINTLWHQWLVSETSLSATLDTPTLERAWLVGLGYTSDSNPDLWMEYLTDLGYSGSVNDMLVAFWTDGGPVEPAAGGTSLVSMAYAFNGQPFVYVPASSGVILSTMAYAFNGQPFASNGNI